MVYWTVNFYLFLSNYQSTLWRNPFSRRHLDKTEEFKRIQEIPTCMHDRLKGFREFYPEEMASRRRVFNSIENTVRSCGFKEMGTPSLEHTQLYIDKSGSEIVDHLYSFTDQGGRDITLTPELTPTVARMVALRGKSLPKPIKWFSTRPFWRYEQVQQGRFREFYQTNVDIF